MTFAKLLGVTLFLLLFVLVGLLFSGHIVRPAPSNEVRLSATLFAKKHQQDMKNRVEAAVLALDLIGQSRAAMGWKEFGQIVEQPLHTIKLDELERKLDEALFLTQQVQDAAITDNIDRVAIQFVRALRDARSGS